MQVMRVLQERMISERTCLCQKCGQPMKLVRGVPKIGEAPELLVFYCRACDQVNSVDVIEQPAPTLWRRQSAAR